MNASTYDPITVSNTPLEDVNEFVYLGSKMTTDGDCEQEIITRISEANQTFDMLKPVWRNSRLSIHTKIRIFKSNVVSVLLYGSGCWKITSSVEQKLEVFQNKCLRRILKFFWPNTISNEDLRNRTGVNPLRETLQVRYWRWLGYVCRRPPGSLIRTELRWTPQEKRKAKRNMAQNCLGKSSGTKDLALTLPPD